MFRKIDNHKRTASVNGKMIVGMFDDGCEDILDFRRTVENEEAGRKLLIEMGYEEYDPNAHLKAMGMVFIDGCYRMPK